MTNLNNSKVKKPSGTKISNLKSENGASNLKIFFLQMEWRNDVGYDPDQIWIQLKKVKNLYNS